MASIRNAIHGSTDSEQNREQSGRFIKSGSTVRRLDGTPSLTTIIPSQPSEFPGPWSNGMTAESHSANRGSIPRGSIPLPFARPPPSFLHSHRLPRLLPFDGRIRHHLVGAVG